MAYMVSYAFQKNVFITVFLTPRYTNRFYNPSHYIIAKKALISPSLFPQVLVDLGNYEVETFNDPLMGNARNMLWFQCLVGMELLFQVPFFIAALYYIGRTNTPSITNNNTSTTSDSSYECYPDGFRAACIAYGAHTSTGLIPILSTFWSPDYDGTTKQSIILTALYFPYLAIPAWLLWVAATDDSTSSSREKSKST